MQIATGDLRNVCGGTAQLIALYGLSLVAQGRNVANFRTFAKGEFRCVICLVASHC
jgi:hypothetical protein